jgi:hypothetical protein
MAGVVIGGETLEVSLPNFKALKAAWRHIAAVRESMDPMASAEAILGVISVGKIGEAVTVDQLEERLKPQEIPNLAPFMNTLMAEVGLAPKPGEGQPAKEEASPSTAISTD